MHVLILLAQRHWTGAAEPVLQIARGLAGRGHRVTFVYTRRPLGHLAGYVNPDLLQVLPDVHLRRKGFFPFSILHDYRRLRSFVTAENVDIVFCHHTHDHWLARFVVRGLKRPPILVRQIHESRQLRRRFGYRWLYRGTEMVIVAARTWKEKLIAEYGLDTSRVFVLPAAVDTEHFHPAQPVQAIRDEVGAEAEDRLVGIVSRIKAGRGHDLALAAFEKVLAQTPAVRLLVVGRGEGKEALEEKVASTAFADRVHFLGYRSDDLPAVYAALDVSLLLGEGSDGSCRAALEAMACGTPVVALPVGTLSESIQDGESGVFVQHDPDDVAAAILEVLAVPFMSERARGHAERELAVEQRVERVETLFRRLADVR
ncbi:MAG: glycosyltransferase family 4 protein [Candidatus Lernaella stagnicola]|nr:glycosyltransferase family 4 protein [Candidatus Lernaella stagnicola]